MKKLNVFMESMKKAEVIEKEDIIFMLSKFVEDENLNYNMISKIYVGEKGYTSQYLTINFKEASLMMMFKRNMLINFKIVEYK